MDSNKLWSVFFICCTAIVITFMIWGMMVDTKHYIPKTDNKHSVKIAAIKELTSNSSAEKIRILGEFLNGK